VRFEHLLGPVGRSDGDALHHALTDALLGAREDVEGTLTSWWDDHPA